MTRPDPAAGIFYMHDHTNIDPATKPDWGTFGSWMWWGWDELNPAADTYNWTTVSDYLSAAAALGKTVALSIMLYPDLDGDATPSWVYALSDPTGETAGWPIIYDGVDSGMTFPKWNDGIWDFWYKKFVIAFGNEFDGDSRIHSIWICTARYGETVTDGLGDGASQHNPMRFFLNAIYWYDEAFPNTPLFMIHSAANTRRELAIECDAHDVHSKMNVLGADLINHTYNHPGDAPLESGSAEVAYYATLGWPTATYSYPGLHHWMAYEHGDIEANPEDMYNAMLVALCHGSRVVDFSNDVDTTLLQQLADVDDSLLGNFWTFCLRIMGHPLNQVAMWVGRNTTERVLSAGYEKGWIGPWTRNNITVNATGYATDEATYTSAPAALTAAGVEYGDAGIGYCTAANLTVSVTGMPPGSYTTTVIYSVTGASAAWAVDTDTMTVAQDGTGTLTSVAGPCYVHLIVIEPGTVSDTNVAPNAPLVPRVEQDGVPTTNPTEVESLTPEFSWTFDDDNASDSQSAYQIAVSSSPLRLLNAIYDMWDSGKVTSSAHSGIVYNFDAGGSALAWDTTYFWRVRTWDDAGATGAWSAAQQFTTREATVPVSANPVREHFRVGAGRVLEWLGANMESSGIRATRPADPTEDGVALILSLSVEEDTSDLCTLIYPQSSEGLTLTDATRSAPTGYSLSTSEGWVKHTAGYALYGEIAAWKKFNDVKMQQGDSLTIHPEYAANTLVDRAVEYLRQRGQKNTYYTIDVICKSQIKPGETIRVVYSEYSEDDCYLSIDDDLYIMAVTTTISIEGLRIQRLECSTMDTEIMSGERILADAVKRVQYL